MTRFAVTANPDPSHPGLAVRVRVLGIDPGSRITGYGVVEVQGATVRYLAHGCIRCTDGNLPERLRHIHGALSSVIHEQQPQEVAVESVFVRRNVKSALVLCHARGVALLAVTQADLPLSEYAPAQVKSAIVGNGRAEKSQIQHMVRALLGLDATPPPDAADALAIALCHARLRGRVILPSGRRRPVRGEGYRSYQP